MNKRIKELIEQATTEEADGFKYFDKQKFAELIVRECVKKVQTGMPVDELEEHFGVE